MEDKDLGRLAAKLMMECMAAIVAGIVGAVVIMSLFGCSAAKPAVTERVAHDTLRVVVRDTVWQDRFVERIVERVRREATSVRDSTVKTVDRDGNVIKEEHWRGEKTRESSEETERQKDSAAMWKARYVAVLKARADSARVENASGQSPKKKTWKERMEDALRSLGRMAAGALAMAAVLWWREKRGKR